MESIDAVQALDALAHPGRLALFRLLVQAGEDGLPAGEAARRMAAPANTLSTQLAILTRTGLIRARREGRSIIYAADYAGIGALLGFLMEDCCQGRAEICAPARAIVGASRGACGPEEGQRQ